ncbi:DUF2339 domain-containing protein [Hymenobacter sp. BT507]|uniref:DUF2339 domain-containing protein n=1 Tax=Hymenobacter citatus TaxID=2763506 RepID=A0ABR7MK52_9BACT|nr:DUF2339 domain-containing protein [Hymenobacter citatus]MBC6611445.1 DUF2339 domain-containing protein [Hymenobacter citatus]
MGTSLLILLLVVGGLLYRRLANRLASLEQRMDTRESDYADLRTTVGRLRPEFNQLRDSLLPTVTMTPIPAPVVPKPPINHPTPTPAPLPAVPVAPVPSPAAEPVPPSPPVSSAPLTPPTLPPAAAPAPPTIPTVPQAAASTPSAVPLTPLPSPAPVAAPVPPAAPAPLPSSPPVATPAPPAAAAAPTTLRPTPNPRPTPPPAMPPKQVAAEPAPPTWWDRAEQIVLENWTGILGAVVLVTGIGFLGVYAALRVSAPVRFGMITAFAAVLLGLHYYLKPKAFAARLHLWLQSSAAAVFLFACVGAVSVPGLQWASPPLSYGLLLAGVAANLWLAWDARRESVATLHGVLSLVALAVLPHTVLTLAAGAGVTAFSIGITYRQRWKYQLLLSILSFFVFHQYWYYSLTAAGPPLTTTGRLTAMGLVLVVGMAAAVVQYRKVYARLQFDVLLFAAHVLNWTCLGINLYQYSTGSVWKTVPLGLGALLTFWVARRARRLGIQWLFRTDSVISLLLALFTAFSLQGWHASGSLIALFMLLETLLVAFIMAREQETVVFQVASVGALLAAGGLLLLNLVQLPAYAPFELHRNAFLLLLAGLLGAGYYRLVRQAPLLQAQEMSMHQVLQTFGGAVGALYAGAAALLLQALFGVPNPPTGSLLAGTLAAAGAVFGVAWWLRGSESRFRTLHLLAGQLLAGVAILGLHKLGLIWPATAALLFIETLLLAGLLGYLREMVASQLLLGAALLSGGWLLLTSTYALASWPGHELHRRLALLFVAGLSSAALLTLPERVARLTELLFSATTRQLHAALKLLTLAFTLAATALLAQALFGVPHPPVAALLSGGAAAGLLFGLTAWWRGSPGWFRPAHLLQGQLLLAVAVLGLHEAGVAWPAAYVLLYGEILLMTLLLAWRAEWLVYQVMVYCALGMAVALPLLVYLTGSVSDFLRAGLLVGAALATLGTQALLTWRNAPVHDVLPLPVTPPYRLQLLGAWVGPLLLAAGGLVYEHTWVGWVAALIGSSLLLVRRYSQVPGLWGGLLLATVGYQLLQWSEILPLDAVFRPGAVLLYWAPLLAVSAVGLGCSWWAARQQHVRWPWLYLLGGQVALGAWAALAPRTKALPILAWAVAAVAAGMTAQLVRCRLVTPAALHRAGSPDRFLLHLTYALLAVALLGHVSLLMAHSPALLLGWPARRLTAGALLLALGAWAWQRSPARAPLYHSWRYLHPLLPEFTLLFGSFVLGYEVRTEWLAPVWILVALMLLLAGRRLPLRLRRVRVYSLLYFGAAVGWSSYAALRYLEPWHLLTLPSLVTGAAALGLFTYTAAAVHHLPRRVAATWPRLLAPLAQLGRLPTTLLIPLLLYPSFVVLTLVLVQSFDRSVLTVLMMVEVLAAFVASLLLRRQDLRYVSLVGTVLCCGRLLLFDLSQHGTITRAVVFILMGVLLLGMNALYARFKSRFTLSVDSADEGSLLEEGEADPLA